MKLKSILVLSLLLAPGASWSKPLKVVATTTDLADLVRQIGGQKVQVDSLAKGYQDPHFVDPKPSFVVKLIKADLFIQTGLELEAGWAPVLIKGARNAKILPGQPGFLDASEAITPIEIPSNPTRAEGDVHPGGNPHYLLDPENAKNVGQLIKNRLSELDPKNADAFENQFQAWRRALDQKIQGWETLMNAHRGRRMVTFHKNFSYFARAFGLEVVGQIEPKPGIPPSTAHTQNLIDLMRSKSAKVILTNPWYDNRGAETVADAAKAVLASVSYFPNEREGSETYLEAMENLIQKLNHALERTR